MITGTFTALELKVLKAFYNSASGNGHDFGFIEDGRGIVGKAQLGALAVSLQAKGLITIHEAVRTDSGRFTQFTWDVDHVAVADLLGIQPE